jgi:hypothetical protein
MKIIFPVLVIALLSSACASHIEHTNKNSKSVQLYYSLEPTVDDALLTDFDRQCESLGEVIGTEGRWYSYLFFSNRLMIQGALNDIKNKASEIGANKVVVYKNIDFMTSVTIIGLAYNCKTIAIKKDRTSNF